MQRRLGRAGDGGLGLENFGLGISDWGFGILVGGLAVLGGSIFTGVVGIVVIYSRRGVLSLEV